MSNDPMLLLLHNFQGIIPQKNSLFCGLDETMIVEQCASQGIQTRRMAITDERLWSEVKRERVAAIYASSQTPRYQKLLRDIVANLDLAGVRLYPGLNEMLAHEDKAFQELRLRLTDINRPRTWVFGTRSEAAEFLQSCSFPLVGKMPEGSCSSGVRLLPHRREALAWADQCLTDEFRGPNRPLAQRLYERVFPPRPIGLVLFQEYIADQKGDWKVLVWGDKACGLYRENRPDDFRASGGGRLNYISIPEQVLEFAWTVRQKLGLLWGSFDIIIKNGEGFLTEYQAIHFGTATADGGHLFSVRSSDGRWSEHRGRIEYEREMADLLAQDMRLLRWI